VKGDGFVKSQIKHFPVKTAFPPLERGAKGISANLKFPPLEKGGGQGGFQASIQQKIPFDPPFSKGEGIISIAGGECPCNSWSFTSPSKVEL
jgi:hypothetical protein